MKIVDLLRTGTPTLSFEVFPPKTDDLYESVLKATREVAALGPDFCSVTYGAGGSTQGYTTEIAVDIKDQGVPALAHLTCVNASRESLDRQLQILKNKGIENILALRGDLPAGVESTEDWEYKHASDLIQVIKDNGDFCIGGACYPEKHPEAKNLSEDIANIKRKCDAGCEFLTTQMFFDNSIFFNYLYRLREAGVTVPVIAGIMPVTNVKQVERIRSLSQAYMPKEFMALLDRFGDNPKAMRQAGLAYAIDQIVDLIASGIDNIHIYTMNKPNNAAYIQNCLSEIVPSCKK